MPTAVVEVQYINQPDKNPDFGSIRAADKTYYGVHKSKLGDFEKGNTYEITYTTKNIRGKDYHTVSDSRPISRTAEAAQKVLNNAYPGTASGVGDRDKNRHIFVCGIMNNAIQHQGLEALADTDKIMAAIDNCTRAYDRSLLATPQKRADMEEEVPY